MRVIELRIKELLDIVFKRLGYSDILLVFPAHCGGSSTGPASGMGSIVVVVVVRQVWTIELIRQRYLPRDPGEYEWVARLPRNTLTDIDRRYPDVHFPHALHSCEHDGRAHGGSSIQKFH